MNNLQRAYRYFLAEPFYWIFLVFFQPARFRREYETTYRRFWQRAVPMLRLTLPSFILCYLLVLIMETILIPFHFLPHINVIYLIITPLFGIAFGIVGSIAFGIAGGITGGIAFGITGGIFVGIASGITGGIFVGIASGISYLIGYYRLPLYLVSGVSNLVAYFRSRQNPPQVFHFLKHSSLQWDERVYLRLPYLKHMLLIACNENPQTALEEARFIDAERPQQLWAARATILELAMRDLEQCQTLSEIAAIHRRIEELFPRGSQLMNPQWATPFKYLDNASLDAQRYATPISRRAKQEALADMLDNLRRVRPSVAFRDERMNARLAQVIEMWTKIVQEEQQRLASIMQTQGTLDNPYLPGLVLQKSNKLFVGRLDIAEQLESALRTQGNPPTFLLNGERRMGKTSTLVQLPHLLGSRYISVFYNLQSPGIYASTAVFLEWLAERLQQELQSRDIKVGSLSPQNRGQLSLFEQETIAPRQAPSVYQNDAFAYHGFNRWLEEVEKLLERDERMLLLAFDEFEMFEKIGADGLLNLPTLFDWFRELIQFHPRIALLFSGVSRLEEMGTLTGIRWTNYFINVRTVHISFLREKDACDLIMKPAEQFPGDEVYRDDVVACILQETGCHPLLVQAVCSALIDMLNVEHRVQATLQDIKETIHTVIDTWGGYFDDQWERTDENQRMCLAILLAGSTNMTGLERQSGLEDQILRQTMRTLLRRDLVRKNDDETYEMTMPMFGRWMRLNYVV